MVAVMRLPVGPHPHSHGENGMFTPPVYSFAGSSPLTRGKRTSRTARSVREGLIPACAGKTAGSFPEWSPFGAHPHSRGENLSVVALYDSGSGSSPLTRKKHVRRACRPPRPGFIPAHAGRTQARPWTSWLPPARPRSREENPADDEWLMGCCSSSPLTRGKQAASRGCCVAAWLIPAHAGKTKCLSVDVVGNSAHPRSRGENCLVVLRWTGRCGSSPLTRGKL